MWYLQVKGETLMDQKKEVETIISRVSKREGVSLSEGRNMVHKYVCGGGCGWYRTRSKEAGFNRSDLTAEQKTIIEEIVREVMKDLSAEEANWRIHEVLCPGHPRPRPK
jgi:transposase